MHRITCIFLFVLLASQTIAQHRPLYSQYMFNGLVLNPAYAGYNNALTTVVHAKRQMVKFPGTPFTQTFSIHSPLVNKKTNLGLLLVHDQFGLTNQTDVSGNFAYRIKTSQQGKLAFGFQAGLAFIKNNLSNLSLSDDQPDAAFEDNFTNLVLPKMGIGIFYNTSKFYAGASMPEIIFYNKNTTNLNASNSHSKLYYLTGGYHLKCNEYLSIKPSLLVKYLKGSPTQLDLNAMLTYNNFISIGSSYRSNDALIFLAEYRKEQISIGYAYDYILSNLGKYSNGSHEVMLRYEFRYAVKAMSPRDFN